MSIIICVKKTHPTAQVPKKSYPSDFCCDVVAVSEEEVAPNVWKYDLGLQFEIVRDEGCPVEHVDVSVDLRARSSVWKTGMVLSNCTGTIDEGYRGEVSAVFYHVMPNMPRYKVGDRVGQIKVGLSTPPIFIEVDELSDSDRGTNGYGSTGK